MYTNIVDSRKPRMHTNIVELSVGLIVYDIRILIRTTGMAYYRFRLFGGGVVYYISRPPELFGKRRPPGLYQDCRPAGDFNILLISS